MKILVYGAAEFGQVVRNLVKNCGYEFEGFIDDYVFATGVARGSKLVADEISSGKYRFGTYEQLKSVASNYKSFAIVIAVGYKDLKTRWSIYQKVKADGFKVGSLVHPQTIVDKTARIGEGAIIMAGAIVDYNVEIKDLAVLWNGVVVSHDSVVGENTFLSPNSTICGCSVVGRDCFVGAGAVITDHVKISDGSFIGAGKVELKKIRMASPHFLKQ